VGRKTLLSSVVFAFIPGHNSCYYNDHPTTFLLAIFQVNLDLPFQYFSSSSFLKREPLGQRFFKVPDTPSGTHTALILGMRLHSMSIVVFVMHVAMTVGEVCDSM